MLLKKPKKNQILIFTFSIGIFLLNILQGSKINFTTSECLPVRLEGVILILTVIILITSLIIKKRNIIKRFILPILMSSVIACLIGPIIFLYQMELTNKNLEETCNSIAKFKSGNGRLPIGLYELEDSRCNSTGFKLFNNGFQYEKEDNENFKIFYEVEYGYTCEVRNCSAYDSNLMYTCIACGLVHNEKLNNKE